MRPDVRIDGDTADGTVTFTDGTVIPLSAVPTTGAEGIHSIEPSEGFVAGWVVP